MYVKHDLQVTGIKLSDNCTLGKLVRLQAVILSQQCNRQWIFTLDILLVPVVFVSDFSIMHLNYAP